MAKQQIGSFVVGTSIQLNVNNSPREFIIVHQGKPSSIYDDSCDGTWLLMKDIYEERKWNSSNDNDYSYSTIDSYLNSTFLGLLDANIQNAIKQVKLPYRAGSGSGKTVTSGANGLSAKIFLLSSTEVNLVHGYEPTNEGACLSYFSGTAQNGADTKRVAYLSGSSTSWWLRSPYCNSDVGSAYALRVLSNGRWDYSNCSKSFGIRPALVLDSTYELDLPYDLTVAIPSKIQTGDILNCPYSGSIKSITLPKGTYKLECWGAQGGSYSDTYHGGFGGYSVGTLRLDSPRTLYLVSGGSGSVKDSKGYIDGGYNGGGGAQASNSRNLAGAGGGATHISLSDGLLSTLSGNKESVLLVAGGGGGSASIYLFSNGYKRGSGGNGGGSSGENGVVLAGGYSTPTGGTQNSGGTVDSNLSSASSYVAASFGQGSYAKTGTTPGGGGGYYGGGSGYYASGAGGSGYISGQLSDASTLAGSSSFLSPDGNSETGHSGDGYIRITVIKVSTGDILVKTTSNTWKK